MRTLSARSDIYEPLYSCEIAYETKRYSIAFAGVIAIFFAFDLFAFEGALLAPPAPFKVFRAAAFLGD